MKRMLSKVIARRASKIMESISLFSALFKRIGTGPTRIHSPRHPRSDTRPPHQRPELPHTKKNSLDTLPYFSPFSHRGYRAISNSQRRDCTEPGPLTGEFPNLPEPCSVNAPYCRVDDCESTPAARYLLSQTCMSLNPLPLDPPSIETVVTSCMRMTFRIIVQIFGSWINGTVRGSTEGGGRIHVGVPCTRLKLQMSRGKTANLLDEIRS